MLFRSCTWSHQQRLYNPVTGTEEANVTWQTKVTYTLRRLRRSHSLRMNPVTSSRAMMVSWTGLVFPKTAPMEMSAEAVHISATTRLYMCPLGHVCMSNTANSKGAPPTSSNWCWPSLCSTRTPFRWERWPIGSPRQPRGGWSRCCWSHIGRERSLRSQILGRQSPVHPGTLEKNQKYMMFWGKTQILWGLTSQLSVWAYQFPTATPPTPPWRTYQV